MTGRIDVFISYKREERALSEKVRGALIDAGYTAITDLNIAKNEEFGDAIDTMIRTAKLTLVLWTKASAASDWVRKEARLARDLEKAAKPNRYLGVMVENVDLDLPPDLRGLQMVDIHAGGLDEAGIAQVVAEVREILGIEAQQAAQKAESDSAALSEEWQYYDLARSINVAAAYRRFLARYPDGEFADDARRQLGMFTWYLHPFRRGNASNTIAALGIVGTISAAVWGATRDPVILGIDPDDHAVIVAERDAALARAEDLAEEKDAEAARADRGVAALQIEHDAPLVQLAEHDAPPKVEAECDANGEPGIRMPQIDRCIALDAPYLNFEHERNLTDLSPLSALTSLQALNLSFTEVSDLSPLKNLNSLESLFLRETLVSDLSPLQNLTELTGLGTPDVAYHEGRDAVQAAIAEWSP
ncbi:MAG: TIR domain-containing protein [Pseudomonadota bacterium]